MYSHKLANFESDYDLVALGIQNVWICEVGSKEMHGSFENFTASILNSAVCFRLFSSFCKSPLFKKFLLHSRLKFPTPTMTVSLSV